MSEIAECIFDGIRVRILHPSCDLVLRTWNPLSDGRDIHPNGKYQTCSRTWIRSRSLGNISENRPRKDLSIKTEGLPVTFD
jgi:hypothetical protein